MIRYVFSEHALRRWRDHFGDSHDPYFLIQHPRTFTAGKRTKQKIKDNCPAHRHLVRKDSRIWYRVSTNAKGRSRVVFVCAVSSIKSGGGKENELVVDVITVFPLEYREDSRDG